ncbi:MAG: rhodanese-like domain-containing protein [Xanthomonadales bacterium]|nr:rhodanese-like domain-containing protein [Xanthomonadales bacterium]
MPRSVLRYALLALLLAAPALAWAGDAYWIDVRTAEEYAAGHVSQAVNIPYEEIAQRISEVTTEKDAEIYVYCRSGRRSGIAKAALDEAGFTRVVNAGGLEDALKKAAAAAPVH